MNNFRELRLINDPIRDNYIFPQSVSTIGHPTYIQMPLEFLKYEIINTLELCNIKIATAILFRKKPGNKNPLHIDAVMTSNGLQKWGCAINWNLTKSNSEMSWYETSEKEIIIRKKYNNNLDHFGNFLGIHFGHANNKIIDHCKTKLIETKHIDKPTLVRIDIPHQIKNTDQKDRWCLSLRTENNYTWSEALEIFKPFYL